MYDISSIIRIDAEIISVNAFNRSQKVGVVAFVKLPEMEAEDGAGAALSAASAPNAVGLVHFPPEKLGPAVGSTFVKGPATSGVGAIGLPPSARLPTLPTDGYPEAFSLVPLTTCGISHQPRSVVGRHFENDDDVNIELSGIKRNVNDHNVHILASAECSNTLALTAVTRSVNLVRDIAWETPQNRARESSLSMGGAPIFEDDTGAVLGVDCVWSAKGTAVGASVVSGGLPVTATVSTDGGRDMHSSRTSVRTSGTWLPSPSSFLGDDTPSMPLLSPQVSTVLSSTRHEVAAGENGPGRGRPSTAPLSVLLDDVGNTAQSLQRVDMEHAAAVSFGLDSMFVDQRSIGPVIGRPCVRSENIPEISSIASRTVEGHHRVDWPSPGRQPAPYELPKFRLPSDPTYCVCSSVNTALQPPVTTAAFSAVTTERDTVFVPKARPHDLHRSRSQFLGQYAPEINETSHFFSRRGSVGDHAHKMHHSLSTEPAVVYTENVYRPPTQFHALPTASASSRLLSDAEMTSPAHENRVVNPRVPPKLYARPIPLAERQSSCRTLQQSPTDFEVESINSFVENLAPLPTEASSRYSAHSHRSSKVSVNSHARGARSSVCSHASTQREALHLAAKLSSDLADAMKDTRRDALEREKNALELIKIAREDAAKREELAQQYARDQTQAQAKLLLAQSEKQTSLLLSQADCMRTATVSDYEKMLAQEKLLAQAEIRNALLQHKIDSHAQLFANSHLHTEKPVLGASQSHRDTKNPQTTPKQLQQRCQMTSSDDVSQDLQISSPDSFTGLHTSVPYLHTTTSVGTTIERSSDSARQNAADLPWADKIQCRAVSLQQSDSDKTTYSTPAAVYTIPTVSTDCYNIYSTVPTPRSVCALARNATTLRATAAQSDIISVLHTSSTPTESDFSVEHLISGLSTAHVPPTIPQMENITEKLSFDDISTLNRHLQEQSELISNLQRKCADLQQINANARPTTSNSDLQAEINQQNASMENVLYNDAAAELQPLAQNTCMRGYTAAVSVTPFLPGRPQAVGAYTAGIVTSLHDVTVGPPGRQTTALSADLLQSADLSAQLPRIQTLATVPGPHDRYTSCMPAGTGQYTDRLQMLAAATDIPSTLALHGDYLHDMHGRPAFTAVPDRQRHLFIDSTATTNTTHGSTIPIQDDSTVVHTLGSVLPVDSTHTSLPYGNVPPHLTQDVRPLPCNFNQLTGLIPAYVDQTLLVPTQSQLNIQPCCSHIATPTVPVFSDAATFYNLAHTLEAARPDMMSHQPMVGSLTPYQMPTLIQQSAASAACTYGYTVPVQHSLMTTAVTSQLPVPMLTGTPCVTAQTHISSAHLVPPTNIFSGAPTVYNSNLTSQPTLSDVHYSTGVAASTTAYHMTELQQTTDMKSLSTVTSNTAVTLQQPLLPQVMASQPTATSLHTGTQYTTVPQLTQTQTQSTSNTATQPLTVRTLSVATTPQTQAASTLITTGAGDDQPSHTPPNTENSGNSMPPTNNSTTGSNTSAVIPVQPPAAQTIIVLRNTETVKKYDGKTSLSSFKDHFNRIAHLNGWVSDADKLQHLCVSLESEAAELVRDVDDTSSSALDDLWTALFRRFGVLDEKNDNQRRFENRRQNPEESLQAYAASLQSLHRRGWPTMQSEDRLPELKRKFENGVISADLAQFLQLHAKTDGFYETLKRARQYEEILNHTTSRKTVRILETEQPLHTDVQPSALQAEFEPILQGLRELLQAHKPNPTVRNISTSENNNINNARRSNTQAQKPNQTGPRNAARNGQQESGQTAPRPNLRDQSTSPTPYNRERSTSADSRYSGPRYGTSSPGPRGYGGTSPSPTQSYQQRGYSPGNRGRQSNWSGQRQQRPLPRYHNNSGPRFNNNSYGSSGVPYQQRQRHPPPAIGYQGNQNCPEQQQQPSQHQSICAEVVTSQPSRGNRQWQPRAGQQWQQQDNRQWQNQNQSPQQSTTNPGCRQRSQSLDGRPPSRGVCFVCGEDRCHSRLHPVGVPQPYRPVYQQTDATQGNGAWNQ